jgi:hypothetical protein
MFICKYCKDIKKNSNSGKNHEHWCKLNPNRKVFKKTASTGQNQYTKAKRLGLEKPEISQLTRDKLSKAAIKNNTNRVKSEQSLQKLKNTISKKIENGEWHTSYNKGKTFYYNGIKLDSSWEVKYAEYLDKNNIKWQRNKKYFNYVFEGKNRRYYPDFYLISTNEYIEIKGFIKDLDKAKWEQFPKEEKLIILMKKELLELGIQV